MCLFVQDKELALFGCGFLIASKEKDKIDINIENVQIKHLFDYIIEIQKIQKIQFIIIIKL